MRVLHVLTAEIDCGAGEDARTVCVLLASLSGFAS